MGTNKSKTRRLAAGLLLTFCSVTLAHAASERSQGGHHWRWQSPRPTFGAGKALAATVILTAALLTGCATPEDPTAPGRSGANAGCEFLPVDSVNALGPLGQRLQVASGRVKAHAEASQGGSHEAAATTLEQAWLAHAAASEASSHTFKILDHSVDANLRGSGAEACNSDPRWRDVRDKRHQLAARNSDVFLDTKALERLVGEKAAPHDLRAATNRLASSLSKVSLTLENIVLTIAGKPARTQANHGSATEPADLHKELADLEKRIRYLEWQVASNQFAPGTEPAQLAELKRRREALLQAQHSE